MKRGNSPEVTRVYKKTPEEQALKDECIQGDLLEELQMEIAGEPIPMETYYHPDEMQERQYESQVRQLDESYMA